MIRVELPGGGIAEFPSGTSPAVIEKALQDLSVQTEAKSRVAQMSPLRKALYGAERALDEPAMGLKQITPEFLGGGMNETERRELAIRRAMENQIPGSGISRFVGDVALTGGPLLRAGQYAARLFPNALKFAGYAGAAGGGAAVGALQPTLEGESRTGNAAKGAAFGTAGQAVGNVTSGAISGLVRRSDAARSLPQNVQDAATLGQLADRATPSGRMVANIEERLKSVPVLGTTIENARDRGVDAWRQSVLGRGSVTGTPAPGANTREQLAGNYQQFQTAYANALRNQQVPPSQFFEQQVLRITSDPRSGVPAEVAERIRNDIMANYQSRFAAGAPSNAPAGTGLTTGGSPGVPTFMRGEEAKDFEGFLSGMARRYGRSEAPLDPNIGRMYDELERAWSASYKRQLGSGVRQQLRPLDQAYGPYKTLEKASGTLGNIGGDFTPAQLTNAVATRTGKARFGRGEGVLADEALAGKTVFQDRLPNSGTADRLMLTGAAGAMALEPVTTGLTALGIAGTMPLFTSRVGKNLMTGDTRTQMLLKAIRADRALRAGGAPAAINAQEALLNDPTEY